MDAQDLVEQWTALWNGDLSLAERLLTDDFQIHFGGVDEASKAGDSVRGPGQMAAYVDEFRAARPGLLFEVETAPVQDEGGMAFRWRASRDGVERSGIDLLRLDDSRIAEAWSVMGGRRFP
jgi:hypothetical protein